MVKNYKCKWEVNGKLKIDFIKYVRQMLGTQTLSPCGTHHLSSVSLLAAKLFVEGEGSLPVEVSKMRQLAPMIKAQYGATVYHDGEEWMDRIKGDMIGMVVERLNSNEYRKAINMIEAMRIMGDE